MAPNDFRELLTRAPFEPFRMHLSNGMSHEVRHPELAVVKLTVVWLYFPAKDFPIPFAASKVVVVLRQIVEVEFLSSEAVSSAN